MRARGVTVALVAALMTSMLVAVPGTAQAACARTSFTTDAGFASANGVRGRVSEPQFTSRQSTCRDVNMDWVGGPDTYAAQYAQSSLTGRITWVTGSGGRRQFPGGRIAPAWVPIRDLAAGNRYRAWSQDNVQAVNMFD